MVLVDTSVWVRHLRDDHPRLLALLQDAEVTCHPFVVGELSCGTMRNRGEILGLLQALPVAPVAELPEFLDFVEAHGLAGCGIGFVDVHLLASARLARLPLWTLDRRLKSVAGRMGVSYG